MIDSAPWKWDEVTDTQWRIPAEDVFYLAARWRGDGRKTLLDLGCGTGRHSVFFAEQGFSVDAFDLSDAGIARLKQTALDRKLSIRTQVGDMLDLPYPPSAFDCLLAFHVIYHSDKAGTERTISEIHRVLAHGGEAYVTFNSRSSPKFSEPTNRHIDAYTVVPTQGLETGIPHYYVDEAEVRRLLGAFEIIRFTHVTEILADDSRCHYFVLVRNS